MPGEGKKNRARGDALEREVVQAAKDRGLPAQRVPLSGAAGGLYSGDVQIDGYLGEAKRRKKLPAYFQEWLGDNDFCAIREDRGRRMYLLSEEAFFNLLSKAGSK